MDKRLIIAAVLSVIVLFGYPYLMKKVYPPAPAPTASVEKTAGEAAKAGTVKTAAAEKAARPAPPPVEETLTTVDTPLFRAVFTNVGGAVKSWELKKYRDARDPASPVVNLVKTPGGGTTNSTRLTVGSATEEVFFTPSTTALSLSGDDSGELVYTGRTSSGLIVQKKYTFTAGSYTAATEVVVQNPAASEAGGRLETVLTSGFSSEGDKAQYHAGPLVKTSGDFIRQDPEQAIEKGRDVLEWIGLEDKYFLSVIVPDYKEASVWTTEVLSIDSSIATVQTDLAIAPGGKAVYSYRSFMGPKEYDRLVSLGAGLGEAIEFGMFSFMAKPLLVILNFFQKFVVNYGIAIIIVTVIIKVIFYPLTKHSLSSMKEMQKIQPQLAAVKERYKDDKEKMNKELMELYKKYKINPVGGCLPMILQIPVFIALYEVLYVAIELRHAPLFLWITDLSAKDPYYITPLLMGGTMFLQQKMTPTSMDPSQAKIMLLMPVVFTFMFLNFPSGLVLYWLVNNILSIGQQYMIYRTPTAKA